MIAIIDGQCVEIEMPLSRSFPETFGHTDFVANVHIDSTSFTKGTIFKKELDVVSLQTLMRMTAKNGNIFLLVRYYLS